MKFFYGVNSFVMPQIIKIDGNKRTAKQVQKLKFNIGVMIYLIHV